MPKTYLNTPCEVTKTGFNLTLCDDKDTNRRNLSKLVGEMRRKSEFESSRYDYKIWMTEENGTSQLHFDKQGTFEKIFSSIICCTASTQISPAAWMLLDDLLPRESMDTRDQVLLEDLFYFQHLPTHEAAENPSELHEIERVMKKDPNLAASMCYQATDIDRHALSRVLNQPEVLEKVIAQLGQHPPEERIKMAYVVLNMGHSIPDSCELPTDVKTMMKTRRRTAQSYYDEKIKKHFASRLEFNPYFEILPYYYKGEKYLTKDVNLNGELRANNHGEKMVCRHLSHVINEKPENCKEILQRITSSKMQKSQSFKHGRSYEELEHETWMCPNTPFVISDDKNFGRLLTDLQAMLEPGKSTGYFLVAYKHDESHEMWLYIEKKVHDKNNTNMVRVGVYDPNVTGNMMHIQCLPEDLHRLELSDFMAQYGIANYTTSKTFAVGNVPEKFANDAINRYVGKERQLASVFPALTLGNAAHIEKVVQNLPSSPLSVDPTLLKELSKSLFVAVFTNHSEAIDAFGGLIRKLNLRQDELKELLHGTDSNGMPALYMAFQFGHVETIKAYGRLLHGLNLNDDDLKELIEAKNSRGTPGLALALYLGHTKPIAAFGDVLEMFESRLGKKYLNNFLHTEALETYSITMELQQLRKKFKVLS